MKAILSALISVPVESICAGPKHPEFQLDAISQLPIKPECTGTTETHAIVNTGSVKAAVQEI